MLLKIQLKLLFFIIIEKKVLAQIAENQIIHYFVEQNARIKLVMDIC